MTRRAAGRSSLSRARRLLVTSENRDCTPVMRPPGRAMLSTRPKSTGSLPETKTIWTCDLDRCAASATLTAKATITFTPPRSEEHTSELQSLTNLVCRLLLEKKKKKKIKIIYKKKIKKHITKQTVNIKN